MAEIRIPLTVELSMDGQKITMVADPTEDGDAVNLAYLNQALGGTPSESHDYFILISEDDPRDGLDINGDGTNENPALNDAIGIPVGLMSNAGDIRNGSRIVVQRPAGITGEFYFSMNIDTTLLSIGENSFRSGGFILGFERFGINDNDLDILDDDDNEIGHYETFVTRFNDDRIEFTVTIG